MPNPSAAKKTASAPKKFLVGTLLAVVIIVVACTLWHANAPQLRAGSRTYRLDVASTSAQQELGLGNRPSMAANRGMLFVFHTAGNYCFWMKGMHFPLDIIWTDATKRIVKIEPNLSPKTYPQTYCPSTAARYVIELDAGQTAAAHMQVGQQLKF